MICLGCKRVGRIVMTIYKEVSIEEIARTSTNKQPIAHYIDVDKKIAKIPIGGICKKCLKKELGKTYNQKEGVGQNWRDGFNAWRADPRYSK